MPPAKKKPRKASPLIPRDVARMAAVDCFIEGFTWCKMSGDRITDPVAVRAAARAAATSRIRGLEAAVDAAAKRVKR